MSGLLVAPVVLRAPRTLLLSVAPFGLNFFISENQIGDYPLYCSYKPHPLFYFSTRKADRDSSAELLYYGGGFGLGGCAARSCLPSSWNLRSLS